MHTWSQQINVDTVQSLVFSLPLSTPMKGVFNVKNYNFAPTAETLIKAGCGNAWWDNYCIWEFSGAVVGNSGQVGRLYCTVW